MRRLALVLLLRCGPSALAATSPEGVFRDVANERALHGRVLPRTHRLFEVDGNELERILRGAPREGSREASKGPFAVLHLPMPDGLFARFRVIVSPIFEPSLAAKFPEIRTFRAQGLDEPGASARLDISPEGLHAIVLSAAGTTYIDPVGDGLHVSYDKRDAVPRDAVRCEAERSRLESEILTALPAVSSGSVLRTYRLAVAATGEYTAAAGGSVAAAVAAITTTINRVDAIYERDVAVRFVLVANESAIVYTNASSDPYTNGNLNAMQAENQTNLDAQIGTANYDIGHVFGTSGGGSASPGSACQAGVKARGVSAAASSSGDPFDVDIVAHEIGHQLGATHTFNASGPGTGACDAARVSGSAYEPGSGSTIMSFAGLCGSEDLQPHHDDYFHARSYDEIVSFTRVGAGASCGTSNPIGNLAPSVSTNAAYNIPKGTPFTLTAVGSDPTGDALTYCWEEQDLGSPAPPEGDDGSRPLFRSFLPRLDPSRTFPKLSDILNGTTTLGESLPSTSRAMTFRVTARDNRLGGGLAGSATAQLNVIPSAGPFAVTVPSTAVTWAGGSTQTIRWNEAFTASPPVSCPNVNVTLSTDGGNTFDILLLSGVPNVSSASILVPRVNTNQARIKIACANNVFFAISRPNFTITTSTTCVPSATTLCLAGNRFSASVAWKNQYTGGATGVGTAVTLSNDTGYFWFFDARNVELIVKVLDGRAANGKFWVFYGALSDVEYTLTVTDTTTGAIKSYYNSPGTLKSVADTSAF